MLKHRNTWGMLLLCFALFVIPSQNVLGQSIKQENPPQDNKNSVYVPLITKYLPKPVWIGMEGGPVTALVVDPQDSNIVYAGGWGAGVFKSEDAGATWYPARLGLTNLYINSMAIDPTDSSVLYAGTYHKGIFKTTNGGASWFAINDGIQKSAIVYTIAVDPKSSNYVYIGTRGVSDDGNAPWAGILYRSDDGGETWHKELTQIGGEDSEDWIYSIAVVPHSPKVVLAASHEHGVYISTDRGNTWSTRSEGITDSSGRAVLIDPRYYSPFTGYYGVWHRTGVFKTTDSGESWYLKDSGIAGAKIYAMALAASNPRYLFAATFGSGILTSSDAGSSWTGEHGPADDIYSVASDPNHRSVLYAGTVDEGTFKSTDTGNSWKLSQKGLVQTWATSLLTYQGVGEYMMMSTYGQGVAQSFNGGDTFSYLNTSLGDKHVNALMKNPAQTNLVYALTQAKGLYRMNLSDTAEGWKKVSISLPASTARVAYDESNPLSIPEMPDADLPVDITDMRKSTVDADEDMAADVVPLKAIQFAPSDPNIVYLATAGGGVYKSTTNGRTWAASGLDNMTVWGIAVDPTNANLVYAATNVIGGGIKVSTDGGASWGDANIPDVTVYALNAPVSEGGRVYAGTSNGIYRLEGGVWSSMGLAGLEATAFAVAPNAANIYFAGTSAGAYYSTDNGATWMAGPEEIAYMTIQGITFDANHPQQVYFITEGGGVLQIEY